MPSWTDLNIPESLKQACAAVRQQTEADFAAFVENSLRQFGVSKVEHLNAQQRRHLEEAIMQKWKGFYLVEGKNAHGRTIPEIAQDDAGRAEKVAEAKADLSKDGHVTTQLEDEHAENGEKITKITMDNMKADQGKIVQEPGVKTDAALTLSPSERSKIEAAAKKLGLKESEQLDEISKDLMNRYVKKANTSHRRLEKEYDKLSDAEALARHHQDYDKRREIDDRMDVNYHKTLARETGIDRATQKLASRSDEADLKHLKTSSLRSKMSQAKKASDKRAVDAIQKELEHRKRGIDKAVDKLMRGDHD